MSTDNGVWISKKRLLESLKNASNDRLLSPAKRTLHQRKINEKIFVWAGIPQKKGIKSGILSLKRMGFRYVRLIDGNFFVST